MGCGRERHSETESRADTPPRILDLSIDAANQPRDGGPLIAGESVRIGMRIRHGRAPYRVSVTSTTAGAGEPVIDASLEVAPKQATAAGVEVAMRTAIAARASAGRYRLEATIVDAAGARATAVTDELTIVGEGATILPAPKASPFVDITDAGGRRRASFVRGELLSVRARFGKTAATVGSVRIRDPFGDMIAESSDLKLAKDGQLSLVFYVPRLARPGDYAVEVSAGGEPPAQASLRVESPPFPAVDRLTIDDLRLWGGEDRRAPRRGRLTRGELLLVEVRVGGALSDPVAVLRLPGGESFEIGHAKVGAPAPDRRLFVRGEWRIPSTLPTGRARIEIEVTDGNHVSTLYREVLIE